jgi:hypothetical protein
MTNTENIQKKSATTKNILQLGSSLVGVKFFDRETEIPTGIEKLSGHRYCQALMKARHGEHVLLDAEGIACPAAAAAFGFKPLPEGLKTGKGLVGFGIVKEETTGKIMFEGMTTLPQGKLKTLYLFPLETATFGQSGKRSVEVLYFKANLSCCKARACDALQADVDSVLIKYFPDKKIDFKVIRLAEEANKDLVAKYNAKSQTVVIVKKKGNKEIATEVSSIVQEYAKTYDKEKFENELKEKISASL